MSDLYIIAWVMLGWLYGVITTVIILTAYYGGRR